MNSCLRLRVEERDGLWIKWHQGEERVPGVGGLFEDLPSP